MLKSFLIAMGFVLILSAPVAFAQTANAPATSTTTETVPAKADSKATSWFSSLGNGGAKSAAHAGNSTGQHHPHVYRDRNSSHVASHASRTRNKHTQSVSSDTTAKSSSKSWFGTH
jgi:hypothetical protein